MAVYTDISEYELSDFLTSYNIGSLLSCKGIAEGVENSNFLLHTQKDAYILTLYEKRVNEKDLPFFFGLMHHLAGKGIACPQPIAAKDGALVSHLAGRPAAVITFLEGMWIRKPNVAHCRSVGAVLARVHLAGEDFSMKHENSLSLSGWRTLWNACRTRANAFATDLSVEIDRELDNLEDLWPVDLPVGIIHADLFPDNVFFLGDRLSGLIDFYFACNDLLAYDIAVCLNAWCFEKDGSFNLTKGSAMLSAYCRERPLTESELAFLPLLARGAAIRFFLTRLYDWFYSPENGLVVKKDPLEYLRKLRFFGQIRQISELGLSKI
ncbi:MAG: homoserine kinase type II [Candidatus Tokpelaia sp. JSC189]|nr:MAG: homoserine kinase type II [Candidatus Tokpelaia sp. JSC189]